ncbi:late competence development ComFB family protein [Lawsonibacter sp. DFI.6.74]|nr:late competence development ComFB family protein [Lawsonibacter sp. DFI.6.74]MCG4773484.1 late competence development ComFB family protein [Lawsonibacter sp. DFI.5.51]
MSASKESNSSKTAHVMNLLSRTRANPAAEAAAQEKAVQPAEAAVPPTPTAAAVPPTPAAAAPAPAPAPAESAPQSTPPTSPIIASLSSDHAISSQIKDALASSLEELAESEPVAETPPAPVVEEVPQPKPVVETPPAPVVEEVPQPKSVAEEPAAPVIEEVPQPEPVVETPPAPVAVDSAAEKPDEEEVICANIMEILVERKAETYMELFGLCCCDRCKMDVQALALTELPAKYVVMAKNELPLRLSLYEGRMNTAVTAQILRACKVVLAEPRHKLFPL